MLASQRRLVALIVSFSAENLASCEQSNLILVALTSCFHVRFAILAHYLPELPIRTYFDVHWDGLMAFDNVSEGREIMIGYYSIEMSIHGFSATHH